MKFVRLTLVTLALPLFSQFAQACPDLTGTFLCPKNAGHPDLLYSFSRVPFGADWKFTVTAALSDGMIVNEFEFATDGIDRDVFDRISRRRVHVVASCDATTLTVTGTAEPTPGKTTPISEKLSLTPDANLSNYSLNAQGVTIHEICQRQP